MSEFILVSLFFESEFELLELFSSVLSDDELKRPENQFFIFSQKPLSEIIFLIASLSVASTFTSSPSTVSLVFSNIPKSLLPENKSLNQLPIDEKKPSERFIFIPAS